MYASFGKPLSGFVALWRQFCNDSFKIENFEQFQLTSNMLMCTI
jgi:hypothetical protein